MKHTTIAHTGMGTEGSAARARFVRFLAHRTGAKPYVPKFALTEF